jgi:hypothetical protein
MTTNGDWIDFDSSGIESDRLWLDIFSLFFSFRPLFFVGFLGKSIEHVWPFHRPDSHEK